jgi:hypothetical protein
MFERQKKARATDIRRSPSRNLRFARWRDPDISLPLGSLEPSRAPGRRLRRCPASWFRGGFHRQVEPFARSISAPVNAVFRRVALVREHSAQRASRKRARSMGCSTHRAFRLGEPNLVTLPLASSVARRRYRKSPSLAFAAACPRLSSGFTRRFRRTRITLAAAPIKSGRRLRFRTTFRRFDSRSLPNRARSLFAKNVRSFARNPSASLSRCRLGPPRREWTAKTSLCRLRLVRLSAPLTPAGKTPLTDFCNRLVEPAPFEPFELPSALAVRELNPSSLHRELSLTLPAARRIRRSFTAERSAEAPKPREDSEETRGPP